jgi:hypothetical protein
MSTHARRSTALLVFFPFFILAFLGCTGQGGERAEATLQTSQALSGSDAVDASSSSSPGLVNAPLQLQVLTNSCGANQMQDFFEVTNTGSAPINLSDISI